MKTNSLFKNRYFVFFVLITFALFCAESCFAQNNRLYATYYGGTERDQGTAVTTDASGNVYMAGHTKSVSGIASGGFQNTIGSTNGYSDAFLVKFSSSGVRLWATYYGGIMTEIVSSVATDAAGNVYLAGYTRSTSGIASGGFENTLSGGFNSDAFLAKFDANGNRLWATYYGGVGGEDWADIAIDPFGNVYLSGATESISGISSGGFQNSYGGGPSDAFLVKFDSSGNRIWATYYGGMDGDAGNNIATDASGNVYLAGNTTSTSGIGFGGFRNTKVGIASSTDAFLVKFDSSGNRLWATYYGGNSLEQYINVATDIYNNVYLTGETHSASGVTSGGFQNIFGGFYDAFLVKFSPSGSRLWATYYGGAGGDVPYGVATDSEGDVYLSGDTGNSSGMAFGGFQNTYGGGNGDAFLVKFDSIGTLQCATYYGGTDIEVDIHIAIDISDNVYLAGITSSISSTASGGFQNIYGGGQYDAFLAKFTTCCTFPPVISISGGANICSGQSTVLAATGGGENLWNTGEMTSVITVSPPITTLYSLIATNGCGSDTATYLVTVVTPQIASFNFTNNAYCQDASNPIPTFINGGIAGVFTSTAGLIIDANTGELNLSTTIPGTYTITNTIAASVSCPLIIATTIVTIASLPSATFSYLSTLYCQSENNPLPIYSVVGVAGIFTSTTGLVIDTNSGKIDLLASAAGRYTVMNTIAASDGCPTVSESAIITIVSTPTANAGSNITINAGSSTQLNATGSGTYNWSPSGGLSCTNCQSTIASPFQTVTYSLTVTDTNGCATTDDITVTIDCGDIFIPNFFSPNNDSQNDLECIYGKCIESITFAIFDRWGEKVFETMDKEQCWDGTYKGKLLGDAVFVYYLKAILITGAEISKQGNISLIR